MSAGKSLPKGWRRVLLGEICEVKRGQTITQKQTEPGDVPVVAGGRTPAYFHNKPNINPPVITVSGSGDAGYVNFFNVPIFASDCSTIQANEGASTFYIYYYLKSRQKQIYALRQGSAQQHVYAKDLRKIEILLPPLSEQKRIVAKLDAQMAAMEKARQAAEKQLSETNLLPAALLRSAFTEYVRKIRGGGRGLLIWERLARCFLASPQKANFIENPPRACLSSKAKRILGIFTLLLGYGA